MGRKVFTREVLSSADVNDYLMEQAVMRFASANARTAEIPSPEPNMLTMLDTDPGALYFWQAAWKRLAGLAGSWIRKGTAAPVAAGAGGLKIYTHVSDAWYGGVSYSVNAIDYSAAGFTEIPAVITSAGGENGASIWAGTDQYSTSSCLVVTRAGANIAGAIVNGVHCIAIGR